MVTVALITLCCGFSRGLELQFTITLILGLGSGLGLGLGLGLVTLTVTAVHVTRKLGIYKDHTAAVSVSLAFLKTVVIFYRGFDQILTLCSLLFISVFKCQDSSIFTSYDFQFHQNDHFPSVSNIIVYIQNV